MKAPNKKIKTVHIPSSVVIGGQKYKITEIGDNAFLGCKKLTKVTIGDSVTRIGINAFANCGKIKTVKLGKNVKNIMPKAFYKCAGIKQIELPKKTRKIGIMAFYGCKKLKTIRIQSENINTIGKKAITNINKNASITVPKGRKKKYKKLFSAKTGFRKPMKIRV